jgi:hypothetical protein
MALRYTGERGGWVPGVASRDYPNDELLAMSKERGVTRVQLENEIAAYGNHERVKADELDDDSDDSSESAPDAPPGPSDGDSAEEGE